MKDINFEVKHGEVLGIIGRNGAGKSTLLKILSRITKPTTGRFELNGRVGSLLEVGTGFHPELTGRENIYLSGAILGMKRQEINRKFDEIVDFAEIEKFLDTPAKHYSSGMYMRLAFSVAAHLEPEILLVDEVLAVGDAEFQKKCLGKMGDVAAEGRTVLFVSHNMGAIRLLCKNSFVLQNGKKIFFGNSSKSIDVYINKNMRSDQLLLNHISEIDTNLEIFSVSVNNSEKDVLFLDSENTTLTIKIIGKVKRPLKMDLEIRLYDIYGSPLALYSPGHYYGYAAEIPIGDFLIERSIKFPKGMNKGTYFISFLLADPNICIWANLEKALQLTVEGFPMLTGRIIDYTSGAGWIFLNSNLNL